MADPHNLVTMLAAFAGYSLMDTSKTVQKTGLDMRRRKPVAGTILAAAVLTELTPLQATVLGLMFAHATNNLLNDYTDSRRGIDRDNYYRNQYGVHVLEDGLMNEAQFWRYLGVTACIALALGGWLIFQRSGLTLETQVPASELVETGARLLFGPIVLFGAYIFVHGHLSPGGGFQGGAVVASAVLMLLLADRRIRLPHLFMNWMESMVGFAYVLTGLAGLIVAALVAWLLKLPDALSTLSASGDFIMVNVRTLLYVVICIPLFFHVYILYYILTVFRFHF